MVREREILNKGLYPRKAEGTITIFLSLVLLLILSLICTVIEGARVSTAKVFAERALTTALDSSLAQFYGPLWEEYHIFGYYPGDGSDIEQINLIKTVLADDMSYTFNPVQGKEGFLPKGSLELYDISLDNISVNSKADLLDYEGKLVINEAVEYMKYREIGNGLEALLGKLNLLETPGKVSYIMEEKQKVEAELVGIDREVLKLMELYDGLQTSDKGIELAKDGSLKVTAAFIKKLCYDDISMEAVGINQENIFEVQKGNYVNPSVYFMAMKNNFTEINQLLEEEQAFQTEIELAERDINERRAELSRLNDIEDKSKADKKRITGIKKEILVLNSYIEERKNWIQELEESVDSLSSTIKTTGSELSGMVDGIVPLIDSAITSIDNIIIKTEKAAPLIKQYEKILSSQEETLPPEVYEGLQEQLKELKKYTSADGTGYDFTGRKVILENNRTVLTNTKNSLTSLQEALSRKDYQTAEAAALEAEEALKSYQIKGLTLDYSTLVYDKTGVKTPLDEVNDILQGGLLSLVVDSARISDKQLQTAEAANLLPSEIHSLTEEKEDLISNITAFFKNSVIGSQNSGMGALFGDFQDGTQLGDAVGESINGLAELLLYQEYLKNHFESFKAEGADINGMKPSVLQYEQEYLLSGKISDQDNLASIATRIIFLRMIFDFVSVLSDSTIRNEAKAIAASLVGFTGLPILVSITQILILLIWSFTEALLDVSALMLGKKVPILKKDIILTFPEIFLINRAFLQEKASSFTETKELSLSYKEYLTIFLLMTGKEKLAYRSLDLMQENIRLRYDVAAFKIEDCYYGLDVTAEFRIKSKFISIPFLKRFVNYSAEGFRYKVSTAYSY